MILHDIFVNLQGPEKGEVVDDEEGMKTMRQLGENMAWLLKKMKT